VKVFWSSVGDIIESTPFLPIQVNVPDLMAAMASFLTQRLPLVNRITNPNEPRPNIKTPQATQDMPLQYGELPVAQHFQNVQTAAPLPMQYADFPVDQNLLEYRQLSPPTRSKPKKNKKRKQNKRKQGTKKTNAQQVNLGDATILQSTNPQKTTLRTEATVSQKTRYRTNPSKKTADASTPRSQVTRAWFTRATSELPTMAPRTTTETLKIFNHFNSPDADQVKYKNMPFNRKVNRWADKELFNFKHSDINNSPIMILNMPSRPLFFYKYQHQLDPEHQLPKFPNH